MKRRTLITTLATSPVLLAASLGDAQTSLEATIVEVQTRIAARRASGNLVPADWVLAQLGTRDQVELGILIFELVRRVPYRLTSWTGDPDSLFNTGFGDCRHKEATQRRLLTMAGINARHVQILFDWAHLPIPSEILGILSETRGFHDTVEVDVNGRPVIVDATWDPSLARAGFPVQANWNGVSPTLPVTTGKLLLVRPDDLPKEQNLYDYFGVGWPNRELTNRFNRALNLWFDLVRSGQ